MYVRWPRGSETEGDGGGGASSSSQLTRGYVIMLPFCVCTPNKRNERIVRDTREVHNIYSYLCTYTYCILCTVSVYAAHTPFFVECTYILCKNVSAMSEIEKEGMREREREFRCERKRGRKSERLRENLGVR